MSFRSAVVLLAVVVTVSLTGSRASAHEHRMVGDGQYEISIGFIEEPAFLGEKNGLYLRVGKTAPLNATPEAEGEEHDEEGEAAHDEEALTPVEGLDTTLQAEVIYGDQRMSLSLTPAFNEAGTYLSYFFPMAEGDYTYRLTGQIEAVTIDETFTSSPDGFDAVVPRLEFPTTARVDASDDTAGLPAISGAVALAGLAVGGVAYARRRSVI